MEKFTKVIDKEIDRLNQEISRINEDRVNLENRRNIYSKLLLKLKGVNNSKNVNLAFSIDMGLFENVFGDTESVINDIKRLKELKTMYNMFYIDNKQTLEIIGICKKYSEILSDKIEFLEKELEDSSKKEGILEEYNNIREIISRNIDFTDVTKLLMFVKDMNISLNDKIDIIREINSQVFKIEAEALTEDVPDTNEDIEVIDVVNISNINVEDVQALFSKYGYDIHSIFDDEDIDRIVKYGNLQNMEEILIAIKDIKLNNDKKQSSKLANIFVLSNGEIVKTVLDNIKADSKANFSSDNYSLSEIFNSYLDCYPLFIKGNKSLDKVNGKGPGGDGPINESVTGSFGKYLAIRNIIKSEDNDADINAMIERSGSVFVQCSARSFKKRLEKFKLYGATKDNYFGTLSCFLGNHSLDIIDVFRELGHDKYLFKGGFSTTCRRVDNINMTLSLIKLYNKRGESIYFREPDGDKRKYYKLKGYISTPKSGSKGGMILAGDTRDMLDMGLIVKTSDIAFPKRNGEKGVILSELGRFENYCNRYYEENVTKYDEYDRIISDNENDNITSMSLNNIYIRELDDAYKVSEYLYDIDGVMISRFKVLRVFETLLSNRLGNLDGLFVAITRNSILTKDELERIDKEIRGGTRDMAHDSENVKTLRRSGK